MFACVYFALDKQLAKVPVGYIKKFDISRYKPENVYKVFWSREIHSLQSEDEESMARLRNLQEPPGKGFWNVEQGEGYYSAHVLRIEDSLDVLIESLKKKRPPIPLFLQQEEFSTTEDDVANLQLEKSMKKQEEAEMKKKEQAMKRMRAEDIIKRAKRSRRTTYEKIDFDNDSDDNEDPEVMPKTEFLELKSAYDHLEKEKDSLEKKFCELKKENYNLKKDIEVLEKENEEVRELRVLNRQLQEKLLNVHGGCSHAGRESEVPSESEEIEIDLGAGVKLDKKIYKEIFEVDHVRKFTKSLAVAIWGTNVLAERSPLRK